MRFARLFFRALQPIAPERTAALAERLFFTAPQVRLSPAERATLEQSAPFSLTVAARRIAGWSWGPGDGPAGVPGAWLGIEGRPPRGVRRPTPGRGAIGW